MHSTEHLALQSWSTLKGCDPAFCSYINRADTDCSRQLHSRVARGTPVRIPVLIPRIRLLASHAPVRHLSMGGQDTHRAFAYFYSLRTVTCQVQEDKLLPRTDSNALQRDVRRELWSLPNSLA